VRIRIHTAFQLQAQVDQDNQLAASLVKYVIAAD
jgi:hypothetical protein